MIDIDDIYEAAQVEDAITDPETAHLTINKDEVVSKNSITGLEVEPEKIEDGIEVSITVKEGNKIERPVHLCFGMTPSEGEQYIVMDIEVERDAEIGILAHCVFPRAVDIKHVMDAEIRVRENATYKYLEKHVHGEEGGIEVIPRADITLEKNARFETDFELVDGRVGLLDVDYETTCHENSVMEMTAKIDGREDDEINLYETGNLVGEGARGVLNTRVAVRDEATAEVDNKLTATAPEARGHVDCKEIVQDDATAKAVPIVDVSDPKAHVTHEAAIGSVDAKQLQTLMSRGLSEDEAVDLIIEGLLN